MPQSKEDDFKKNASVLCLGEKKKILKETMHFQYMTYMATP